MIGGVARLALRQTMHGRHEQATGRRHKGDLLSQVGTTGKHDPASDADLAATRLLRHAAVSVARTSTSYRQQSGNGHT